jgi:hypothetical protein
MVVRNKTRVTVIKPNTVTGEVGLEVYQLGYKKRAIRYETYITGM